MGKLAREKLKWPQRILTARGAVFTRKKGTRFFILRVKRGDRGTKRPRKARFAVGGGWL